MGKKKFWWQIKTVKIQTVDNLCSSYWLKNRFFSLSLSLSEHSWICSKSVWHIELNFAFFFPALNGAIALKIDHCTNVFIMFKNLYSKHIYLFIKKIFFVRRFGYVSMWPRFWDFCFCACVFVFLSFFFSFHSIQYNISDEVEGARILPSMWHLFCRFFVMFDWLLRSFFFISLGDHVAISTQHTLFFLSSILLLFLREKKRQTHLTFALEMKNI